ncbi:MAG: flagellar hook-associated protein FlgL [Oscillospiraceae bacterium]|nr:flagellar hook-associated protein FlgL [Oscillospiraceae bacterium]
MGNRITNSMMISNFNRDLNMNMQRMNRHESQLATNRKIVRISDDPVGVIKSTKARSKLNDVEQFRRNVDDAKAWMTSTESAVSEINGIIIRAYELTVQGANDVLGKDERSALADEIRQLREHLVQVGNTTLGDKYIFGGYNSSMQPYTVERDEPSDKFGNWTLWYNGSSGERVYNSELGMWETITADNVPYDMVNEDPVELDKANAVLNYEIGFGIYMDVGVGGVDFMGREIRDPANDELFLERNLYKMFDDLAKWLDNFDPEEDELYDSEAGNRQIQPYIEQLQVAQRKNLAILADLGGRQNRLDLMLDRYSQDDINYTQMKSDVEDLDQAKAIMEFSMSEAVYRAALSVGAKIIQPTLVDFLR